MIMHIVALPASSMRAVGFHEAEVYRGEEPYDCRVNLSPA